MVIGFAGGFPCRHYSCPFVKFVVQRSCVWTSRPEFPCRGLDSSHKIEAAEPPRPAASPPKFDFSTGIAFTTPSEHLRPAAAEHHCHGQAGGKECPGRRLRDDVQISRDLAECQCLPARDESPCVIRHTDGPCASVEAR